MEELGLSGATRAVIEHAREFVRLEIQLASAELKKKAAAFAAGLGLTGGAAILAFLALCFVAGNATTM